MSVVFLDELPLFRMDTSHSRPSQFLNVSVMTLNGIHQRSTTIPGPVGTLPLDYFIYILIGVLVLLCCSFSIWNIFKAMISPKKYFKTMRNEPSVDVVSLYRAKKPPAPGRMNAMARDEVQKYRTQQRYQADGFLERSLVEKPNLPLPVGGKATGPEARSGPGITIGDIEAWGNLVQEKEAVNVTIANLERLAQAERRAGQMGATDPRLHAALQRHADIENSIKATFEGFRGRRREWSTEEWQVIELIMQYSPR
jgi:hypothetical protein